MGQRCVCGSWDPASWEPLTRTTGPFIYSASLIAESLVPQNASWCKRSFTSNIIINADININLQNSEPPCKMPLHDNYHVDKDPPFPSYRYFALGLLYHYKGQDSAALQVWTSNTHSLCCCCQKATNSEMLFLVINLACVFICHFNNRRGFALWMVTCRTRPDLISILTLWTSCAPAPVWT